MHDGHLLYEVSDGVATITFNRPAVLNALLPETGDELRALVDRAEADDAVRVIVLTGAGRAFSAGADLTLMGRADRLGRSAMEGRRRNLHGAAITERLLRREKPAIAAVNGVAAGMACAYVLACDFAISAASARFLFSFIKVGFVPDSGATWLLAQRVGVANAQRIALTGEPIAATEAVRLNLVSEVVPDDQFTARVRAVATTIATHSPDAVRLTRTLLASAAAGDFHQAVQAEALAQGLLGQTAEHQEAVRAFIAKRPPARTGPAKKEG